jgi:hypothetical protein
VPADVDPNIDEESYEDILAALADEAATFRRLAIEAIRRASEVDGQLQVLRNLAHMADGR